MSNKKRVADDLDDKANQLSKILLTTLEQQNNPLGVLIPFELFRELYNAYMAGYVDATDEALKTIKKI